MIPRISQGVFTALSNMDWYQLVVPEAGVYTGPGVSSAIAANRISSEAEMQFEFGSALVFFVIFL